MRVIIAGSRTFFDEAKLNREMDELVPLDTKGEVVVLCGCARGADVLGERWAKRRGYEVELHPADWQAFGKAAGYMRNREMAEAADTCIVFWDGKSPGSKMMIEIARENGLDTKVVRI